MGSHNKNSVEIAGIIVNIIFESTVVVLTWLKTIFIVRQMRHSVTRNQSSLSEVIFYNGEGSILNSTARVLNTHRLTFRHDAFYVGLVNPIPK